MQLPTEVFGAVAVVHAPDEVGEDQSPALLSYCAGLAQTQIVLDLAPGVFPVGRASHVESRPAELVFGGPQDGDLIVAKDDLFRHVG